MSEFIPFSEKYLHHPFCNFYHRPRDGCSMCDKFFERYGPTGDKCSEELIQKFFPNVRVQK